MEPKDIEYKAKSKGGHYYLQKELAGRIMTCSQEQRELCNYVKFSTSLIDNGELIINMWTLDGNLIKFNNCAQSKTGFREEEVLGKGWIGKFVPEKGVPALEEIFKLMRRGEVPPVHEGEIYSKDSRELHIIWSNYLIEDINGKPDMAISIGMDITELRETGEELASSYKELQDVYSKLETAQLQLEEQLEQQNLIKESLLKSEERYKLVVDGSKHGIWDMDLEKGINFFSDRCIEMLGYTRTEVTIGFRHWLELIHPQERRKIYTALSDYLDKKVPEYNVEYRIRNKQGEYIWVASSGAAIWDENNRPIRIAGSHTNIQERKRAEEDIYNLAFYDELTGLSNKTLLMQKLSSEINLARLNNSKLALLFMDLDNFKNVNDTLGHKKGDELLKNIGGIFDEFIGNDITAARFGGDEFVLLIKNIKDENAVVDLCSKVVLRFKRPISVDNREFSISTSIGAVIYPEDGQDEYALLKNADIAMYNAKDQNGSSFILFDERMNQRVQEKLELEDGLRAALKNDEFILHYQPQVKIGSNKVTGLEALIRWQHPSNGLIPPFKFIPVAEETSLIIDIGELVLRKACKQFVQWEKQKIEPQRIAVNISAKQFEQKDFIRVVQRIIEDTGMNPKFLELEITESIAMKNLDYTINVINELRKLNIRVSLDDFGTGFSSLNYLMRLPIDTLKIDKSFLDNIKLDSTEELIAKTIIKLARKMKLDVVAEGVETIEQLSFLKRQRCNTVQGYLFSKPVPEESVKNILIKKEIPI